MDTRRVGIPKSVAGRINAMISKGDLPPGAKLPSQRQLSTQFGVSRASIREAISHLEASGTLRTEPGRGTFVVPSSNGSIAHRLVDEGGATSYARLDLCQFRHMLEGQSARLAAMRVTDDDLAAIEKNLRRFRDQTRAHELHEASVTDFEFHGLIIRTAGVKMFIDLHNAYREMLIGMIEMPSSLYNRAWEPVVEHERVFEALKRRDPEEARYYMQSHIVRSAERLGILLADDVV